MSEVVKRPFRILSLDGGGIRGAFAASFLAGLEARLDCRIADYFDLIAGTSTGAIIAAALAMREPAARIETFYRNRGPAIFSRRTPVKLSWKEKLFLSVARPIVRKKLGIEIDYDNMLQTKYESKELKEALSEVFHGTLLGESPSRLIIPSLDMNRGQTVVFKTPHLPGMTRDRHFPIVDVLLATTAAPTYFPHASIGAGDVYIDGGLWANNPSVAAIVEVMRISNEAGLNVGLSDVHLLSVGTGTNAAYGEPPGDLAGLVWWGPKVFNASSIAQAQGTEFQVKHLLGSRATRIDFDIPSATWTLDNLQIVNQLIAKGMNKAAESLAELRSKFFDTTASYSYDPLPDVERAG
jgi:patatin-like phospholipase/acyl hydrolase